jgi:hypothetical protein
MSSRAEILVHRLARNDRCRSDGPAMSADGSAAKPPNDEQHFALKAAAGVCHNDEWDRKRDDKLLSTGTDADLVQFIRIGFAAAGASTGCSARDPANETGLP